MIKSIARLLDLQFVRFLLVGGGNTVAGYSIFATLYFTIGASIGYNLCAFLTHCIWSPFGYFFMGRFVFGRNQRYWMGFLRFQLMSIAPMAVTLISLPIMVEIVGLNPYAAQAFTTVLVVVVSYFGNRYITFRKTRN